MSQAGRFWQQVDKRSKATNQNATSIGQVVGLDPFSISYNGITVSKQYGDNVYVNNLLLDEQKTFTTAVAITAKTHNTQENVDVTENHTAIINDITGWLSSIHERFILSIGDYVAVQKLGNNTYIVLEKVQQL